MKFRKSEVPQLDINTASEILENILDTNGLPRNSIPLDTLISYSNYRKERFFLQRSILVVIMTLFFLLPLLFIVPTFDISLKDSSSVGRPVYTLDVEKSFPVDRVTAVIDGHNMPVYESGSHTFSVEPAQNGQMDVTVTLFNRQFLTKSVDVTTVDLTAPRLVRNRTDDDYLYLYLEDDVSGVDIKNTRAVDSEGDPVDLVSWDAETGCARFDYPDNSLNVYFVDYAGNSLQLVINVK